MASKADRLRLLTDTRLSNQARLLGLYIDARGGGEISHVEFGSVLHGTVAETIRRHLRQLVELGYVERTPGGRGHHDHYRFLGPTENEGLKDSPHTQNEGVTVTPNIQMGGLNEPRAHVDVVVTDEQMDGRTEPPCSPPVSIDRRAEEALQKHDALFAGCRNALRDYLATRVPPARQSAYVHAVAAYFNDSQPVFRRSDGSRAPPGERPAIVATALNELLEHGERDAEKPMKWPDGDVRNLRTKINILLQDEGDARRNGNGTTGSYGRGAERAAGAAAGGRPERRQRDFGV